MRVALDTNVLVYAQGVDDAERQALAENVVRNLRIGETFVPVQVVGELYAVLVRRGRTRDLAKNATEFWRTAFTQIETTSDLLTTAIELATQNQLSLWDAVVLSAAAKARCDLLLSEDFQEGFTWRGVTVVNPFSAKPHKMLARLLRE